MVDDRRRDHGSDLTTQDIDGIDTLVSGVVQFGVMLGLLWMTVGRRGYGLRHEIGLVVRVREAYWMLVGVGASIAFGIIALPITWLWDRGNHATQAIGDEVKASSSMAKVGLVILVVVIAPFVEEAVFNKWTRRARPRRGDIILSREAPLGEVGLLRSDAKVFLEDQKMVARMRIRSIAIIGLQLAENIWNAIADVFRKAITKAIGWTVL